MTRWTSFVFCAAGGVLMITAGWLMPIYLRAVDANVLERAGRNTPGLVNEGVKLAGKNRDAARLMLEAAQLKELPGRETLASEVAHSPAPEPPGANARTSELLRHDPEPVTTVIVRARHRDRLLDELKGSSRPDVQALLRFRARTNTVIFTPSRSSSGQVLDTAIGLTGALLQDGQLSDALSQELFVFASEAAIGGDSERFEQILLDVMSLGQRFNWNQLTEFVRRVEDRETLTRLAHLARHTTELPVLFSAVQLSGNARGVASYLVQFGQTGARDLGWALRLNAGGVNELLKRNQRVYESDLPKVGVDYSLRAPRVALMVKWFLYLAGGFLLAIAIHFARVVPQMERPLHVRGFHVAREFLFAFGFLTVALLFSEPFLAGESQRVQMPLKLRLPMMGDAAGPGISAVAATTKSFMNQSLLTLLLFFVIQALIYTACVVKLAEIRRQPIAPRIKLKLLENEDHLFDAGLYLGFVGTIISLILVSLGVVKPSLMAAYSSTSFGIIFVSAFKIFNLRPLRRKLLLDAEAASGETAPPPGAPTYPVMP